MRPELRTLTSLRFFAALHVLLLHAVPVFLGVRFLELPPLALAFVTNGFVGVPFFYALSGFVLTYSRSDVPATRFFLRRFARLAPAFYLALAIGAWFHWVALRARLGNGAPIAFAGHLAANLAFVQSWFPDSLGFDLPAWSLSVEAFFYATCPLLLPRLSRLSVRGARAALGSAFLLSLVPQLTGYLLARPAGQWPRQLHLVDPAVASFLQFNPLVHWGEFLFGAALARLHELGVRPRRPDLWLGTGAAGWLAGAALGSAIPVNFLGGPVLLPAFALVLLGGAGARGPGTRWLEAPGLVLLGGASYALYILHDPLKDWAVLARGAWLPHAPDEACAAIFTIGAVAVSVAVFLFWEKPLRKRLAGT